MNIAILNCHNATKVCTGASCFKAYNGAEKSFADYQEKPTLCAFFHCGGCGMDWENDTDMAHKMERLKTEGVTRVHVGVCVGPKCENRGRILAMLNRYGMEIVEGTH